MKILVCGGAGYIGSHMMRYLLREGHVPVVFDNLSTGHSESIPGVQLIEGDVLDAGMLDQIFSSASFDAVVHLCAHSLVGESVSHPYRYYQANVAGTLSLLQATHRAGVRRLFFHRAQPSAALSSMSTTWPQHIRWRSTPWIHTMARTSSTWATARASAYWRSSGQPK